jgi:hypothetical protein
MASRVIKLACFFEGDVFRAEKVKQLTSLISSAAYDAGMDVEATTDGDLITIIITAEKVTNEHLYKFGLVLNEEYQKIPHDFVTLH